MRKYNLPSINKSVETVILANGEFPSHPLPLSILNNCEYLICCDGAINNLVEKNIQPNIIVGDCDSLSTENLKQFGNIVHRISEQDTNDLTKSVNYSLSQNRKKIAILGATGKREDHTIGNISLLCDYMKYADVEMITDYGIFIGIETTSAFESHRGQQVSLFSLDNSPITTHNLKYSVQNHIFTSWWQATLNESTDKEFIIETHGRVIVYRVF